MSGSLPTSGTTWKPVEKNSFFNFRHKMGAHWLPVLMFTLIWGLVGGVAPMFVPRGPHQSLIQVKWEPTAATCKSAFQEPNIKILEKINCVY